MIFPVVSGKLRTDSLPHTLVRSAILLLLIVSGVFSQPPQPRSEEDRASEMKRR